MSIENIVLEDDIRNHTLQVDTAEIPRRVKAACKQVNLSLLILSMSIQLSQRRAVEQASSPLCQKRASEGIMAAMKEGGARLRSEVVVRIMDVFRKSQGHRRISCGQSCTTQ